MLDCFAPVHIRGVGEPVAAENFVRDFLLRKVHQAGVGQDSNTRQLKNKINLTLVASRYYWTATFVLNHKN